ncbi:MAG TPA: hypothetical protein VER98_05605 [Terriglobia bacterium]|nr:hypothetical protein [Terriglobia bacterium]
MAGWAPRVRVPPVKPVEHAMANRDTAIIDVVADESFAQLTLMVLPFQSLGKYQSNESSAEGFDLKANPEDPFSGDPTRAPRFCMIRIRFRI